MEGFEKLLEKNKTAVERWVKAKIGSLSDAEDILQETYLSAFQSFSSLKSQASFLPWLLGIARRKCADWYRAKAASKVILTDQMPEISCDAPEESMVEETLTLLPERDQLMLRLFYQQMLSQRQIAEHLQIPEGTVKSRMNAARTRFKHAYPYPPKGGNSMEQSNKAALPKLLPQYTIAWKNEAPFPVVCEEMMGWFIPPHPGEKLTWGMYDLPSRRLDVSYEMAVAGPAKVHGLEGVTIRAKVLPPPASFDEADPIRDAVAASTGGQEEWTFIAQEKDGFTRFLSAEHMEGETRTLTTFLDGDAFMDNWGFGEDNQGFPIHVSPQGKIKREGSAVTAEKGVYMDVAGRCEVSLGGQIHDTVCLMDLGMYEQGMVSEQFLGRDGRTVLWRRFNQDDWALDRYGKTWSAMLPENETITINGKLYVHWYDCLCLR